MNATASPRVKICCIGSVAEAWLAIERGASALGLVSEMPSGPGVISEEMIAEIVRALPPAIGSFLLTSKLDAREIIDQQRRSRVNTIQICDRLSPESHLQLRRALPGVSLVQVVHVTGEESVTEAAAVAPFVDAILLDSGNQSLAIKELGGTGRVHNWALSAQIRKAVKTPVFLAGGLNAGNLAEAIRQVGPFGVDVCSGVRTNGMLDENKLVRFIEAARASSREIPEPSHSQV